MISAQEIEQELSDLTTTAKLEHCADKINEALTTYDEAHDEIGITVELVSSYVEREVSQSSIPSSALQEWQARLDSQWGAQHITQIRTHGQKYLNLRRSADEEIRNLWKGKDIADLVQPHVSIPTSVVPLILKLARQTSFEVARYRIEQQIDRRLANTRSKKVGVLPRDIQQIINEIEDPAQNETLNLLENGCGIITMNRRKKRKVRVDRTFQAPSKSNQLAATPPVTRTSENAPFSDSPEIELGRKRQRSLSQHSSAGVSDSLNKPMSPKTMARLDNDEHWTRSSNNVPQSSKTLHDGDQTEHPSTSDEAAEYDSNHSPEGYRQWMSTVHDLSADNFNVRRESFQENEPTENLSWTTEPDLKPWQANLAKSQQQGVPENTYEGALCSLDDNQWLSTTAIDLLLRMIPCDNAKIYDGSFMCVEQPESMLNKTSIHRANNHITLFPTNHRSCHWTLVVLDPSTTQIEFYDSLHDPKYEKEARAATRYWLQKLSTLDKADINQVPWFFKVIDCPKQSNTNDCGISVLVCAIHRILDLTLPKSINLTLWRRVLRAALAGSEEDCQQPNDEIRAPLQVAFSGSNQRASDSDAKTLAQEFEIRKEEYRIAHSELSLVENIQSALDALLDKARKQLDKSTAQYDQHQKSFESHSSLLKTYQTFETQHEQVTNAIQESIAAEECAQVKQNRESQLLKSIRLGWEAGKAVYNVEWELQVKNAEWARASMAEIVQDLEALHQQLLTSVTITERLQSRCKESLDAL